MLDAFKIKPYELEPVYVSWPDAPIFKGTSNDDPVAWLKAIKAGCKERKVPKEYWDRVGRHYMGPKPRERLEELGKVMQQMTGNKHVWNWKKFKIAVQNLGWGKPAPIKETKVSERTTTERPITERPVPRKQGSWWVIGKAESEQEKEKETAEVIVAKRKDASSAGDDTASLTTVSKAPVWLVNACQALDFLTSEHPKAMSAMSAILITVGAIPSIPVISAGAGGAILASSAVQAAGAVAMGIGHCLKAIQDGQAKIEQPSK